MCEDPAQATAEALLQAKTDEEKKMIFDKIAMDSRPGGQQTAVVDFEADVGLVLTDSVHGVMIELIEAGSAASQHKGIKPGDCVLEVDETEATDLRAEQIEEMLIGKEGTTVRLKLQSDLFSQAHAVTLMRQSLEDISARGLGALAQVRRRGVSRAKPRLRQSPAGTRCHPQTGGRWILL